MSEEQARDAGIERALGGAPIAWQVDAVSAVRLVALRQTYLDADDVWDELTRMGARTPANRGALAGVLRQCASKGRAWIEPTDRSTKSDGDGRHKSRIMVWRSLICGSRDPATLAWNDVFRATGPQPGAALRRVEADQGRHSASSSRRGR